MNKNLTTKQTLTERLTQRSDNDFEEIKKDLETMSEKEFCENYGIFKIGNMYFRS